MTTCLPLQNHTSTNLSSTSSSTCNSKWGPYSSVRDFDANMVMILIVLVCATILAFFLNAAVRLVLRCLRRSSTPPSSREKEGGLAELPAPLVYTAGMELEGAWEVAECAICLAEFVEGDRVTVLPACHHGFHARCAEAWLASRPSCPTCRASCRAPHLPHEEA